MDFLNEILNEGEVVTSIKVHECVCGERTHTIKIFGPANNPKIYRLCKNHDEQYVAAYRERFLK
jgi:hypothetical protein